MQRKNEWTMPKWMEKYMEFIGNTGGNPVEELMNDHETTYEVNAIRALLCVSVKSQVALLYRLAKYGHLAGVDPEKLEFP